MGVPVIYFNERKAEWTYDVHCALLKAEIADPTLRDNPRWRRLREVAFDDFQLSFVKSGTTL